MNDKIKAKEIGGHSLPKLHGHTKITLRNVKTGEVETMEKDNLVTDAVANIFARNYFGAMNYQDVTPVRDMFGGVFCFEDELDTEATLPENDGANRLVGHAGQTAHSSESILRGNPNGSLSEIIQGGKGYKFVWDFATNQGNGTISALALTHKWAGDVGLKPIETVADEYLAKVSSPKLMTLNGTDYSDTYPSAFYCLLSVDTENGTGLHVDLSGSSLIVSEVAIDLMKQGINDKLGYSEATDTHEVTLTRSWDYRYASVCTDGEYIYVVGANSNTGSTLQIDRIDMTTWEAEAIDITDASMSLAHYNAEYDHKGCYVNRSIISGGYLYFPKSTRRTFYKVNLDTPADIQELETDMDENFDLTSWGMNEIAEGIILGANFLINGNKVYKAAMPSKRDVVYNMLSADSSVVRMIKDGDAFYVWGYAYWSGYEVRHYASVIFPTCYLATVQNLPSPVTKTNDKTMQIEYSITIAEE